MLGPQPRLLQFFQSLCIVNGKGVISNQELVLREIWLDPKKRSTLFLEVLTIDDDDNTSSSSSTSPSSSLAGNNTAQPQQPLRLPPPPPPPFPPVLNPSTGQVSSSRFSEKEMAAWPASFVGQEYVGLPSPSSSLSRKQAAGRRSGTMRTGRTKSRNKSSDGGGRRWSSDGNSSDGGGGGKNRSRSKSGRWFSGDSDNGGGSGILGGGRSGSREEGNSSSFDGTVATTLSRGLSSRKVPQTDPGCKKWPGVNFRDDPKVGSFRAVYVKWDGSHEWQGTDSLFYPPSTPDNGPSAAAAAKLSADSNHNQGGGGGGGDGDGSETNSNVYEETMGFPPIPSVAYQGSALVRIEALCWVLFPSSLCEAVTGWPWHQVQAAMKVDTVRETCFSRQTQLANFFVAELNLLCDMCYGRSDNCCAAMRLSFKYEVLVSLGYNPHLPPGVRAAFIRMCRLLYLDAYPQVGGWDNSP